MVEGYILANRQQPALLGGMGSTVHIMCGKRNDKFSVGACTGSLSKRYIVGCKNPTS